jgi:hypothetical protein
VVTVRAHRVPVDIISRLANKDNECEHMYCDSKHVNGWRCFAARTIAEAAAAAAAVVVQEKVVASGMKIESAHLIIVV